MLRINPKFQKYFKNFCYSPQIIMLCLYTKFRFSLSYRDIEELCQLRGLTIDHSTFQRWVKRFASLLDGQLRKDKYSVVNRWRMDETYIKVKGKWIYLYRAVDKYGAKVDFLLRSKRNTQAAKRFFEKILRKQGVAPRVIVTDKLRSYGAAKRIILKYTEHRQHKGLNNLVENSHQPTRQKERQMRRFKDPGNTQLFLAARGYFLNLLQISRYKHQAYEYREKMKIAFNIFNESACA